MRNYVPLTTPRYDDLAEYTTPQAMRNVIEVANDLAYQNQGIDNFTIVHATYCTAQIVRGDKEYLEIHFDKNNHLIHVVRVYYTETGRRARRMIKMNWIVANNKQCLKSCFSELFAKKLFK